MSDMLEKMELLLETY